MQIKHLRHKHGGRITALHAVGHDTHKKVAEWFYEGDVEWDDGSKSYATQIPPWALCHGPSVDASLPELNEVSEALNRYLADHGEWHDTKFTRDGRAYSWTPKDKTGSTTLDAIVA